MTDSIEAVFAITRDEYTRAMRRYYWARLRPRRDIIGGLLAVCGGLYFLLATEQATLAWLLIIPGTLLLVLVAYALFLLPVVIYRSQPKLQSEYRLQFREGDIGFQTSEIDAKLQWSMYHSWLRDGEFYILYHGSKDISVIPRRALPSNNDDQLAALLSLKIGSPVSETSAAA